MTWVAHSLGTVISYNVIGDILTRGVELRGQLEKRRRSRAPEKPEPEEDLKLRQNIERVERGLHRFITMGSPLEKIAVLFPGVLWPWPAEAEMKFGRREESRRWWINFYHVWYPVSDRLRSECFKPFATNHHSRLWRLPGLAHSSYFGDIAILKFVISRTLGREFCRWDEPGFLSEKISQLLWRASIGAGLLLIIGLLLALVWWLLALGGAKWLWTNLWDYVAKSLF